MDYNTRDFSDAYKRTFSDIKDVIEKVPTGEYKGIVLISKVGESSEDSRLGTEETYENNTMVIMDSLYQALNTGRLEHLEIEVEVGDYLHVVMNMPNSAEDMRVKMRMYPGLMSDSYIVYREQWPTEALTSVAVAQLDNEVEELLKRGVAESVIRMHAAVEEEASRIWTDEQEKVSVVSQQREEVVRVFLEIYKRNNELISAAREKYEKALENARMTETVESKYKDENNHSRPENEKRKQETDDAFVECQKLEDKATNLRKEVEKDGRKARKVPAEKATSDLETARYELGVAKGRIKSLVLCGCYGRIGSRCRRCSIRVQWCWESLKPHGHFSAKSEARGILCKRRCTRQEAIRCSTLTPTQRANPTCCRQKSYLRMPKRCLHRSRRSWVRC
eukprot:TRINITY_DN14188_c0_g1_i2.p1 TRINITY_DN14188_c0_g1~~TRINITY_DN14188_c0_g1_i2.p1  ORF type:complete len:392 (-),score=66.43 TRINITY_DN14188_c0_g1_i2:122-1297(-)